jgi:WD40 repeat protein
VQKNLVLNRLTGHTGQVHGVVFSPDSERLYSGGVDVGGGRVRGWDWRRGAEVWSVIGASEGSGVQVGISNDGTWLVTSGSGRGCILWLVQGDGLKQYKSLNFSWCGIPIISSDRKWIAATEQNGVRMVSLGNDESRFFSTTDSPGLGIGFSPDARIIASGVRDGTVQVWLVNDGKLLRSFDGKSGPVETVTISPDGQILAAGLSDGKVLLWRVSDGTLLRTLVGHTAKVVSVDFSSGGHWLASGSNNGTVRLWGVKP